MDAGLRRRHPQHPEEGREPDDRPRGTRSRQRVGVERPRHALVARERDPPAADAHLVDAHGERPARDRPAHRHRPDEGVAAVQLGVELVEGLPLGHGVPARVERREADRVPRVDGRDRRQVAREVAVERAPLEGKLVDHARGEPIQASRGASRMRRPTRWPASLNSHSETACQSSALSTRASDAGT